RVLSPTRLPSPLHDRPVVAAFIGPCGGDPGAEAGDAGHRLLQTRAGQAAGGDGRDEGVADRHIAELGLIAAEAEPGGSRPAPAPGGRTAARPPRTSTAPARLAPVTPRPPRGSPASPAADSGAGRSPVRPGPRRWPGMTARAPAAGAAANGGSSRCSSTARSAS